MSYIIEKKVTPLVCHRCSHKWNYGGTNFYVATCPHCRVYVNVRKIMTKQKEVEKEQAIKINTNEKKSDSFDARLFAIVLELTARIGSSITNENLWEVILENSRQAYS